MSRPPPPELSPDGKFYWDGSRWVPMPAQPASDPLPYAHEIRRQYRRALGCSATLGLFVPGALIALSLAHLPR